ncbi:MAG: hypothetical protein QOI61_2462 [Actinomycetota bacterium]
MFHRIGEFQVGTSDLTKLVSDLRGLFVEADPHDGQIRSDFEAMWAPIDGENELRTAPWAPVGAASDKRLSQVLTEFTEWVKKVLAADETDVHR